MMVSDFGAGLVTIGLWLLLSTGRLEIGYLYLSTAVQSAFQSFQWPAYSAAIAAMLPKEHYTRANSLMGLGGPSSQIFAPLLAGALLAVIGLRGIMLIDIVTFLVALGTLAVIAVPPPVRSAEGAASRLPTNPTLYKIYRFRSIMAEVWGVITDYCPI